MINSNTKPQTNITNPIFGGHTLLNADTQTDKSKFVVYRADVVGLDNATPPYFGITHNLNKRKSSAKHQCFTKTEPHKNYPHNILYRKLGIHNKALFEQHVKYTVLFEVDDMATAEAMEDALINSNTCINDMKREDKKREERVILYPKNTVQRWVNDITGEVLEKTATEISRITGISSGNLSNIRLNRKDPINGWSFEGVVGT